jgi:hypothetical protein
MATREEIKAALSELGAPTLRVSTFAGAAVVDDGVAIWTCRPEALLGAAQTMLRGGSAFEGDVARASSALFRRAGCLARGDDADRALHERVVTEWTARSYRGPWRS